MIPGRKINWIIIVLFFQGTVFGIPIANTSHGRGKEQISLLKNIPQNIFPVRRDVPVLPDVIVVKRISNGLSKGGEGFLKVGAISEDHMFPAHRNKNTRLSLIFQIRLLPGSDVFRSCEILSRDPQVIWAEPVYKLRPFYDPNDPQLDKQWYIDKVEARAAWDLRTDREVIIGIVDTGIYYDHDDLTDNIWTNPNEIPGDGIDNDNNGYVDDIRGWDFGGAQRGEPDNDPRERGAIHGTGVAGVAGAVTDNGIGIASPAYRVRLMPVKTSVDADPENFIIYGYEGIVYAADNGAHIINCSFGGSGASNAGREAVDYARQKGALVVAAAGNENSAIPLYPAAYPGVLSVAATNQSDTRANFSNFGYWVDVSAPGDQIFSTWGPDDYEYLRGTSFSSPLTASIAALIKGIHPERTGDQIGEQIRISTDPIDHLNASYAGKLGRGRVNAFRALTVDEPSIRIVNYNLLEGPGSNHDGIFDPGEFLFLTLHMRNYLAQAQGVNIKIKSNHPDVKIQNDQFQVFNWNTMQSWNNQINPVRMEISPDAQRGQTVDVFVDLDANNGYQDFDHFAFDISPVYANIQGGNVRLTLTSMGKLGYIDFPMNQQGVGFVFGSDENLLFEGAVMAATSQYCVSDVARGAEQSVQNSDFETAMGGELVIEIPGDMADEQATAIFTDEMTSNALNLGIILTSLVFKDPPDDDYVLLAYRLYSLTPTILEDFYFGLYMDWDVGRKAAENKPGFIEDLSLGYVYDPSMSLYGGLSVISEDGVTAYKSVKNDDSQEGVYDGYKDTEKWAHLSGGIQDIDHETLSDYSHVLGVGPLTLNVGDTLLVGFAVLGGTGFDDLRTNAFAAREKWQTLFQETGVNDHPHTIPLKFALDTNYPNPFNPSTTIAYTVAQKSLVTLTIHDILGREVARLVDGTQPSGRYEVLWDGHTHHGRAPSGVYFYRLQTANFEKVRKMVLLQ